MYDVITIGSATLDVFIRCPELERREIDGFPRLLLPHGTKIEIDEAVFESGGGATNTATTFARMGLKVATIAKVAEDFAGEKVLRRLQNEGIDGRYMVKAKYDTTDFSTILWTHGVGHVIFVCRGKGRLEVDEIPWKNLRTKWYFISSVEGNINMITKLGRIRTLKTDSEPFFAWNPGKRELSQKEALMSLMPSIDVFIINRKEAADLVGEPFDHIDQILSKTASLTARKKLITDGHNGAYYYDGTRWYFSEAFPANYVEATGAGDAFGSGFVLGLVKNMTPEQCFKLAAANAASVVEHPGAKRGILKQSDVDRWMSKELTIKKL